VKKISIGGFEEDEKRYDTGIGLKKDDDILILLRCMNHLLS
jgi:hypothetical protein